MPLNLKEFYLKIIIGPMFSGKTTYLLDVIKKYSSEGVKTLLISSKTDTRDSSCVITHDGTYHKALKVDKLCDIIHIKDFLHSDVICVDEAQFFGDLYDFVLSVEQHKKYVVISGLDADSDRNKFGQIIDCIPLCNAVEKLESNCMISNDGTKASFSKHIIDKKNTIDIGGKDKYISVSRNNFLGLI